MQTAPSVLFVGSYPPRRCGIATFTRDLAEGLAAVSGRPFRVIAMHNPADAPAYPPEVVRTIRRDHIEDYREAAAFVNHAPVDVVCLQHEFGLFGGEAGAHLFEFLRLLEKPVVATLHTVIRRPAPGYREATLALIRHAHRLVVMSEVAREILVDTYGAPAEKIRLIPHGVPDPPGADPAVVKRELGLEGRWVILTFGLLSRNKGIELALDALPAVVRDHPQVLYVVLGATHPEVLRWEGDVYRRFLEDRVRELGLEEHVRFVNEYVDQETLLRWIHASDLYVTPYPNEEQVVSGTLSYALAMGKPIVSTPYWYARELLAGGRGVLVPFGQPAVLAEAVRELLGDRAQYERISRAARDFGQRMRWPAVAEQYVRLLAEVAAAAALSGAETAAAGDSERRWDEVPICLDHLRRLTDDTGLLQHASYGVPDPRFGYSADDAGRALVVLMELYGRLRRTDGLDLAERYVRFLRHAQRPDGAFHNFVGYDRRFLDDAGSEDTQGRAVWGLGHVAKTAPDAGLRALAREMVQAARPHLENLHHPRAQAYAVCGLFPFAASIEAPAAAEWYALIGRLAENLAARYDRYARPGWEWFDDRLTYGNAILCNAMFLAYLATGRERYRRIGQASLDFLWSCLWNGEYLDLVGNDGWADCRGARAVYGQQPIDAGYLVEALVTANAVTGRVEYARRAHDAFAWFLGRNRLGRPLVDATTGAVSDGLEAHGPSANQGAEAVISFLLARLALERLRVQGRGGEAKVWNRPWHPALARRSDSRRTVPAR